MLEKPARRLYLGYPNVGLDNPNHQRPLMTTTEAAPVSEHDVHSSDQDDERDETYGWEMFVSFCAAVFAITLAVAVLAMVGKWWMLAIAVAVHITITSIMMKLIFHGFQRTPAYADEEGVEAASRAALARIRAHTPLVASR